MPYVPCNSGVGPDDDEDPYDWEVRDSSTPFWKHAVAGSCAGISEHVAMFPIDTVKTRIQASLRPRGVIETFREIIRERGASGLMRGSMTIGIGCVPAHVGLFATYEHTKALLVVDGREHQPIRAAACGASATVVHDMVLTPIDVVKQRLQMGKFQGALDCIMSTWRREGVQAFFRSLPATLVMNVPYNGVLVAANESLKHKFQLDRGDIASAPLHFLTAGVSGAIAATATLPLDVVKTRLQTQGFMRSMDLPAAHSPTLGPRYTGILSTMRLIAQEEGLSAFYRGLVPRVVLAVPSAALCWGTYETVRMLLVGISSPEGGVSAKIVPALGDSSSVSASMTSISSESLEWEEWDRSTPFWQHAVAGSCAGVMEHVAMYPIDTVKTRMQAEPVTPGQVRLGVTQTIRLVLQEEGALGLMRGCWAIGFGCIPAHIALFCTYESAKSRVMDLENAEHQPVRAAFCGALATVAHDMIITPTDVVKQRLQLGRYSGCYDCVTSMWRHEGIKAFYRSLPTTLISECPFHGILVASNESLKLLFGLEDGRGGEESQRLSIGWHFLSTGISGLFAAVCTQPLDVVKTRLQTQNVARVADAASVEVRYSGLFSAVSVIYREEGFTGFFRGMLPRVCFAAPSAALCWGTYEVTKKLFRLYDH